MISDLIMLHDEKLWPIPLTLLEEGRLYRYTPDSDFSQAIILDGFPVLILEIL
jgi:hypothetical protein